MPVMTTKEGRDGGGCFADLVIGWFAAIPIMFFIDWLTALSDGWNLAVSYVMGTVLMHWLVVREERKTASKTRDPFPPQLD